MIKQDFHNLKSPGFFFSPGDEVQIDISSLVVEVCDVGKQNGFSSNFAHFLQRDSGADLENF